ncbi:acyltransferase domain-containing protein [Streptomyces sp. NPDC056460]|uniref:acyltransferase domain-containing protein n=1 Tax=unclassified Streptomyces TaxID=2593676 RepID=UPI001E498954|nr:acyltransferase domain-containing protein [Streptomyces sp. MBT42]MCD2463414.1 acyltransferase domain-containing protein [Streptomyces sp. MBT42]
MSRRTVLLLPGQGAQRERMAAGLYEAVPEFAAPMDSFLAALGPEGARLREEWLRPAPNPSLDDALVSQPLLFGVGYALGRCVTALSGHAPDVLLGHSVGELAAAALAGVFSPEDAAQVMAARRTALAGRTGGGMLAVGAAVADVEPLLTPGAAVAAVNGPRQTVLAGPSDALARTSERLAAAGMVVRALRSGHAFHSPSLAGAAETYARALSHVPLRAPEGALLSTRTARWLRAEEATDPAFWAGQLALPVLYWPALRALLDGTPDGTPDGPGTGLVLLDASADRSLTAPARRHPSVRSGASVVVPLLAGPAGGDDPGTLGEALDVLASHRVRTSPHVRTRAAQATAS